MLLNQSTNLTYYKRHLDLLTTMECQLSRSVSKLITKQPHMARHTHKSDIPTIFQYCCMYSNNNYICTLAWQMLLRGWIWPFHLIWLKGTHAEQGMCTLLGHIVSPPLLWINFVIRFICLFLSFQTFGWSSELVLFYLPYRRNANTWFHDWNAETWILLTSIEITSRWSHIV